MTLTQAQNLRTAYKAVITNGAYSEDCNNNWNGQDSSDMLSLLYSFNVPSGYANKVAFYQFLDECLMGQGHTIDSVVGARPSGIRGSR
jgi:hypothetical protein